MTLAIAFLAAALAHIALRASAVWWVLATAQPLLLVAVAAVRRHAPSSAVWWGLTAGLVIDGLSDRVIGPGGIAGVLLILVVAAVARSFELAGPLFWVVGALLATTTFELAWRAVLRTLSFQADHGWQGTVVSIATTVTLALLVASGERAVAWWRSPTRRRRQRLQRL